MGKKIIIKSAGKTIHAELKDTRSAENFAAKFPFHTSGYNSGVDYCCAADTSSSFAEDEQIGWKNGDIGFGGGWFSILFAGQEQSSAFTDMVIVAHVDEEDLEIVRTLPKEADFTVDFE